MAKTTTATAQEKFAAAREQMTAFGSKIFEAQEKAGQELLDLNKNIVSKSMEMMEENFRQMENFQRFALENQKLLFEMGKRNFETAQKLSEEAMDAGMEQIRPLLKSA